MALIHVPPAAARSGSRRPPDDEIIDLTDRRRVLLRVVLGLDVEPELADAVFDRDRRPAPQRPPISVEGGHFAVEDPPSPTA